MVDRFLCGYLRNGEITDSAELFAEKESVGIDIKRRDEAFYKMQFIKLKEDYSFAFYAVVDDMFPEISDKIVYMGRRKSAFAVTADYSGDSSWAKQRHGDQEYHSQRGISILLLCIGCLSDTERNREFYGGAAGTLQVFHYSDENDVREYQTHYRKTDQKQRFEKSDKLFRVIKAGVSFILRRGTFEAINNMISNDHFETIGMNCILEGGNS